MFDVIIFGSATQDIFLELPNEIDILKNIDAKKYFCLALGDKILVDEMQFFSGGGGTNVACALANLGFKTAYYGKIGNDVAGKVVLDDLASFGVGSKFCFKDKNLSTAFSFVLSCGSDRTILVYKGACHFLSNTELKLEEIKKTKWLYLAPFYEKTAELLPELISFANAKNIKVALNPSIYQIKEKGQELIKSLSGVDILFLNKEEAGILTNNPEANVQELGGQIKKMCSGVVVITLGNEGVVVFEGENFYKAKIYKVGVEDKTGAGDSFGAGFLAGLLMENNIEYAIRLGIVNSAKNISQKGAKIGLLAKSELKFLPNIDIIKERIY